MLNPQKDNLRQEFIRKRNQLSNNEVLALSAEILNMLKKSFQFTGKKISCYATIPEKKEIITRDIISWLSQKNEIYLPVSDFNDNSLQHARYNMGDALVINSYQIPEPSLSAPRIDDDKIDVVFVPLLAVDQYGNRLGYGKGFYDRFLTKCRKDVTFIGLSFFEPLEKIPSDENDVPIHYLVTPKSIHDFRKQ